MKWTNVKLFAFNFWRNVTTLKAFYILYSIFLLLTAYAAVSSIKNYKTQNTIRVEHQAKARQSWEANPDKHPHRMAHFGTFVFREIPALGVFDSGLESFLGNTLFLEAHRQNSVNFSEATFSTGILRFGQLNLALLLQLIAPLILFFIGFASISSDRQNGTLKLLITQGGSWKDILFGKSLGLYLVALLFLIPVFVTVVITLLIYGDTSNDAFIWMRLLVISLSYVVFFFIISVLTIVVSAISKNSKNSLLYLLGIWLLFVVLLPKSIQAIGSYAYPTPSKLAFQSAVEKDVIKTGDSHNPDDPHYNRLKDSVLAVHNVSKIADLPFNYGGFQMREGEKISSKIYRKHYSDLVNIYHSQNDITNMSSIINPFTAIKQSSMIISGTDFSSYLDFQKQADDYRYTLAQTMNELQMEYISSKATSSEGKVNVIDHEHWSAFQDFKYQPTTFSTSFNSALLSIASIAFWLMLSVWLLLFTSKKANAL